MMTTELKLTMDADLLWAAQGVLESIGLDMQTAVRVFLKQTVAHNALPFALTATPAVSAQPVQASVQPMQERIQPVQESASAFTPKRQKKKITPQMCETVWQEFTRRFSQGNSNWSEAARVVAQACGMSQGSAFIYLNIISNLMKGTPNTRNLKIKDLTFFLEKIRMNYGAPALVKALSSLEHSLEYWGENIPGNFTENVSRLIQQFRA